MLCDRAVRTAVLAGALLAAAGCFSPVAEPDYWRWRKLIDQLADGGFPSDVDSGPGGPGCPHTGCGSAGNSSSLESVVATLAAQPWTTISKSTSTCLPTSDELSVSQTVNMRATDVAPPAQCAKVGTCTGLVFELSSGAEGVTCLDQFCTALMLDSAHFRVRMILRDHYPLSPRFAPVVQVLPPCGTACSATEKTCDTSDTCWPSAMDQCRFCLAAPAETCACADHGEGQGCTVYLSNDISCQGHCTAGTCKITPGQTGCPQI